MIVVDASVIACLLIPGARTTAAERVLESDPHWAAPRLWRSEVRNVLATYVRSGLIELTDAVTLFERAALLIGAEEYEPTASEVLRLSRDSGASAYDCEYVALAEHLGVVLVTADSKLLKAFPKRTSRLPGS